METLFEYPSIEEEELNYYPWNPVVRWETNGKLPVKPPMKEGQEFRIEENLFVHQREDVDRMKSTSLNYMVLSEMGTGKTPEIISLVEEEKFKSVLIICPKTIRLEWRRQIIQWTGVDPIVCRRGSGRRLDPLFEAMSNGRINETPYFILNYETFRMERFTELLSMMKWDLIVMDEIHNMRNAETQTTRGLVKFMTSQKQSRVIVMTGSPIVNNPLDIYTLLMIVRPQMHDMKKRREFLDEYTFWTPTGRGRGVKVFGIKYGKREQFHNYTEPFTIRRMKKDVLAYLPDKYRRVVTLDMDPEQEEVYRQMAEELIVELDNEESISAPSVLAKLIRLRQINLDPGILGINAPSSKTEFLMDLVKDGPPKLVVFTTFEQYVKRISRLFEAEGINHVSISGSVSVDERFARVQKFQNDPEVQVALGTIKTMGEGITLTAASDVVLMDRWWTPAANNQAIDRLHRPGQKNAVQIILPTNEGSIDQVLDAILVQKEQVADALLNENSVIAEVLEDLRRMVYKW